MHGQRILVLGGLGFIGSNLVAHAVAQGAKVTVADVVHPRSGANIANVADVAGDIAVHHVDIREVEPMRQLLAEQDVVFNCAALTSHMGSMREPLETLSVNVQGLVNVLEQCRAVNAGVRFVHVGTSTQIGRMLRSPIDETHAEFPLDAYSASKTAAEKYVLLYAQAHGLRTSVVRLANTYGPRAHIRTRDFGFVNYFVGLALQGRDVTVYGEGNQLRNLSFVGDSVDALCRAAADERAVGQVYFAANDVQVSVRQVAETIVHILGGAVQTIPWPAQHAAIEIGDAVISSARIREQLGWTARIQLVEGLQRTCAYYQSRMPEYI